MGLHWLGRQARIGDLLSRRKHARAASLLRAEIAKTGSASPAVRLQLADLLELAGRGEEAMPILVGLADELLADGFPDRAREALERAERIQPDRPGLQQKLIELRTRAARAALTDALEEGPEAPDADAPPLDAPPPQDAAPSFGDPYLKAEPYSWGATDAPPTLGWAFGESPMPEPEASAMDSSVVDGSVPTAYLEDAVEPIAEVFESDTTALPVDSDPLQLVEDFRRGAFAPPAERSPATILFQELSDEELTGVLPGVYVRAIPDGDVIFSEGEVGDTVFAVASGAVKVWVMNPEGRDFEIGEIGAGGIFGEVSAISGRLRAATISAAGPCTLLEIEKDVLDSIARRHAGVRAMLLDLYLDRASSADAAAVRSVSMPADAQRKAEEALRDHFGENRWDARMRLRLADLLAQTGHVDAAVSVLVGIADELAAAGFSRKAITLFKKIERVRRYEVKELRLAPLARMDDSRAAHPGSDTHPPGGRLAAAAKRASSRARCAEEFDTWASRLLRDMPDYALEHDRA
jgi:CRP-like cAMP-binding protein